jgi:hypothetical protein
MSEYADSLDCFNYQRIIAWGPELPFMPGAIYPWVVDGRGILSPCKDVIAVIEELPPTCVEFVCSGHAGSENFNTLYQQSRLPAETTPEWSHPIQPEDTDRLDWLMRNLEGSSLRSIVGEMTWSGDPDEFRARIDERMSG